MSVRVELEEGVNESAVEAARLGDGSAPGEESREETLVGDAAAEAARGVCWRPAMLVTCMRPGVVVPRNPCLDPEACLCLTGDVDPPTR